MRLERCASCGLERLFPHSCNLYVSLSYWRQSLFAGRVNKFIESVLRVKGRYNNSNTAADRGGKTRPRANNKIHTVPRAAPCGINSRAARHDAVTARHFIFIICSHCSPLCCSSRRFLPSAPDFFARAQQRGRICKRNLWRRRWCVGDQARRAPSFSFEANELLWKEMRERERERRESARAHP